MLLPGEVLDSTTPTEEQKSRMTNKQVRGRAGMERLMGFENS